MEFPIFIIPLIVLFVIWYLSFSATRLDRLHQRVETSWANLDAILQRRASLALELTHFQRPTQLQIFYSPQLPIMQGLLIYLFAVRQRAHLPEFYCFLGRRAG